MKVIVSAAPAGLRDAAFTSVVGRVFIGASVLVATACGEDLKLPPTTVAAGNPSGGAAGTSSSGDLSDSGANDSGALCVPVYDTFDAGTIDIDVDVNRGSGEIIGTMTTPAATDQGALVIFSVFTSGNVLIASQRGSLTLSKRAYSFRVRGLPSTSTDHVVRLRAQVDNNTDGTVQNIGDQDGYFGNSPLNPVTDPALAANIDVFTTCAGIDFALDIVRM